MASWIPLTQCGLDALTSLSLTEHHDVLALESAGTYNGQAFILLFKPVPVEEPARCLAGTPINSSHAATCPTSAVEKSFGHFLFANSASPFSIAILLHT